jgi:hypothetical protein
MGSPSARILTGLALVLAQQLGAQDPDLLQQRRNLPARVGPHAIKGHDRADLRRDWNLWWFGGKLSPTYLDYKNQLAAQEMKRYEHLLPQAPGTKLSSAGAFLNNGTGSTWSPLGPTGNLTDATWPDHDSGRPTAIAAASGSNTLYLATSGGGAWKCVNADPASTGDWAWAPITDALPNSASSGNVSVGALALSPVNDQVVYLGLGDAHDAEGRGFYNSTNGGSTWSQATGIGAQTRSYFILPVDANVVLWGTNDGLKQSTNAGGAFAPVTGGPATGKAWSIQAFSATELICAVQAGSGTGSLYRSTDGGATWTLATVNGLDSIKPGRMTLAAVPGGTVAYAEVEDTAAQAVGRGVLKTTDKGQTWTWQAAPTETAGLFQGVGPSMGSDGGQEWYNQAIAVDPSNPDHLIMGANLAMYRSTNGGANWQQLTHWYGRGRVYAHADNHATTTKGGMIYVGNDGGLAIYKDPWRPTIPVTSPDVTFVDNTRNKGLSTHLVYNLGSTIATSPADAKYRVTLGLQDNGTRVRQPATVGDSLTGTEGIFEDRIGGDGFGTLIHPTDGNKMLGTVYYTDVYKSTDGGQTQFKESITGITEANSSTTAPFAPKLALGDSAHPDTVYTATNGVVYQSTDFGDTWTGLSTSGLPAAGTNSTNDPSDALYIRNIGAAYGDPQALGIAANQSRIYLSYNGGSSWTKAGALPGAQSYTSYVWFDRVHSSTVYVTSVAPVATANHIWKSTNSGTSWTALDGSSATSNGFPFGIPVHVVQTDATDPNKVYAGTDFGVYVSTNGGTSWSRFGSGLPMVAVRDLYIAPNGEFIRAATFGRGVWEIPTAAPVGPAVALTPTTVTMVNGGTQAFTPTATNGTSNTVTWTASTGTIGAGPTASGVSQLYTAPASGSSATVTATTVDLPTATATATVSLVAPSAVAVTVSPATVEMAIGSGTQSFTASVSPLTNQGVTWSVTPGGTISPSGTFSAAGLTAGTYTVKATSSASPTSPAGTATVTLVSTTSVTVTVAPATATTLIGGTKTFTATVAGVSAANQGVTWSVSGGGTINSSGLFTATTAGSFTVTATNTFSGATGTATVVVKTLDLNGDGTTDLRDLLTFAKYYGTSNATCDLNGDGIVDGADLTLLTAGL